MNKLRALSLGGAVFLIAVAGWAAWYYGSPSKFIWTVIAGGVAAGLPRALAHGKRGARRLHRKLDDGERISGEKGSIFVSNGIVEDTVDCLETVREAVAADDRYDEVRRDSFAEGPGLTVIHTSFHNSFVRITSAGRVVVSGASERTQDLAETVTDACGISFERTRENPFSPLEPVKGAPRVFLGVFVFSVLLIGFHATAASAYPSDAYNPVERTIVVGIDGQSSLDPRVSETEGRLSKAAFLVTVVEESPVEVRWAGNDSDRVMRQGRQALIVANDTRSLLSSVEADSPTPAQAQRVETLRARLATAERETAAALDRRAQSEAVNEPESIHRLSDRLRASANRSSAPGNA